MRLFRAELTGQPTGVEGVVVIALVGAGGRSS